MEEIKDDNYNSHSHSDNLGYANQLESQAQEQSYYYQQSQAPDSYGKYQSTVNNSRMRVSLDDSGIYQIADSYPSLRRVASPGSMSQSGIRRSIDDSAYIDGRSLKIAQAEQMIREEMFKECTFRPKIKNLPTAYGPLKEFGTPFVTRVNKWERERLQEMEVKARVAIKSEEEECTFRPKISKHSIQAMKEIRGDGGDIPANDRLFSSHKAMIEQRERMRQEELLREQKLKEMECTFQPQLITKDNPQFQHVNAKVHKTPAKKPSQESKANFSFTPQVNKIKPSMTSAKMYLKANVVDRLTRPIGPPEADKVDGAMAKTFDQSFDDGSRMIIDAAAFLGGAGRSSLDGGNSTASLPADKSKDESKVTKQDIENFHERQKLIIQKRQSNLTNLKRSTTPSFKPKITKKADEALKDTDFMMRLELDVQRRQATEQEIVQSLDHENTFKPELSSKAQKMQSRSAVELSRGDLLRKETNRRMLKLRMEQVELAGMTFRPQLSSKSKEYGKSVLRLSEDPSQFLEWTKEKRQQQEKQRELELKRREDEELKNCTFAPTTTQCPAYIKRIAESISKMKSVKSSMSQNGGKPKPEWR